MKKLLLIVDPLSSGHSVQFELIESIAGQLKQYFEVTIISIWIDGAKLSRLERNGINATSGHRKSLTMDRVLTHLNKNNESMLWLESWLREGLFNSNSEELNRIISTQNFDFIINATNTVPVKSDIWWIQGPPLTNTLQDMSKDNYLARLAMVFGKIIIPKIDEKLVRKMKNSSVTLIANAKYCYDYYSSKGLKLNGIVYNTKGFDDFHRTTDSPSRDFVLTYIGKETEIAPIVEIAKRGIKIIGFGSKLPVGSKLEAVKHLIDYRGFVEKSQLMNLYSNALFTAFPFTNEPFGYVPIESMACGTPVLTYNKQGPAETVKHGETGWLVNSQPEFIEVAQRVWKEGKTEMSPVKCVKRSELFTMKNSVKLLLKFLQYN